MYLLPLVDVKTVILQFLLENIGDVDVNMDDLILTFPLNGNVWLNPLKQIGYEPSHTLSKKTWLNNLWNYQPICT